MSALSVEQLQSVVCPVCAAYYGEPCTSTSLGPDDVVHPSRALDAEGAVAGQAREGAVALWNAHRGGDCAKCRAGSTGPWSAQKDSDFCAEGLALRAAAQGGMWK